MIKTLLSSKPKRCDYALVVPFKNESQRLHKLIQKILNLQLQFAVDIILVDGASTDDSLNDWTLEHKDINTIFSIPSRGLSEQLRVGFQYCVEQNYKGIITIDANGKDDPQFIPEIIHKLSSDYDFVQASRYLKGGKGINTPALREIAIRCLHVPLLSLASGFSWTDTTQGYRGYSIKIFLDPKMDLFRDIFITYEMLAYCNYRLPQLKYRCVEIPVVRSYPKGAVPTKIKGLSGHWNLVKILIKTCLGAYNPKISFLKE